MPTISTLASAMFEVEGTNPNLAGNNNPGNLVYAGQAGATQGAGGFAAFPTLAAGESAAEAQINLDITRGSCANGAPINTLADLINCWSPANAAGNSLASTNNYINTVAQATGIDPNESLSDQLANGGISAYAGDTINSLDELFTGVSSSIGGSFDLSSFLDPSQPYLYIGIGMVILVVVKSRGN